LDDLDRVMEVISYYPEIIVKTQLKERMLPFIYHNQHFLLYYPDSHVISAMPLILVRSEDAGQYPPHILLREIPSEHLAYPLAGTYRFICLHDSLDNVFSLYSYEKKIYDTIDNLISLLNMNRVQQEREYQKEFLLYWNNIAELKPSIVVFLAQTECFSKFNVYGCQNCLRLVENGIDLTDLTCKNKGKNIWQHHVEREAFYIPLLDNRGILPTYENKEWSVEDVWRVLFNTQIAYISTDTYSAMKETVVHSKDVLIVFSMIINKITVVFSMLLECKAKSNKSLLKKLENDLFRVKMLHTCRMDYRYLNSVIGNSIEGTSKSVLLIGAGSLGSYIAPELAKNGWKSLTIYDNDCLTSENTMRWYYGTSEGIFNKSIALKFFLQRIHPEIHVAAIQQNLDEVSLKEEVKKNNLAIFTIGSSDTQLYFNQILKKIRCPIPVLYVWLEAGGEYSHILVVNYQKNGCYQCLFTKKDSDQLVNNQATMDMDSLESHVIRNGCGGTRAAYGTAVILRTVAALLEEVKELSVKRENFKTMLIDITPTSINKKLIENTHCHCCNYQ
jgi:molybdopterin/thiamine biosynthesis adenylyltransferase